MRTTNYSITAITRPAPVLVTSPSFRSGRMTVGKLVFTRHNPGLRRDGAPWADTHIRSGPGPTCAGIMSVARPSGSSQARARRGSTRAALSLLPPASSMGRAEFRQQHGAPVRCGSPSVIVTQHRDQDAAVACELADAGHGGCRCKPSHGAGASLSRRLALGRRWWSRPPLMPRLRWWLGQELQQRRGESGRADIVPLTL